MAITGEEDVITDGNEVRIITGGDVLLTKVTGAGCLLTSVLGAFAAVEANLACRYGGPGLLRGRGGESAERTADQGPGSFQIAFLDELAKLHPGSLEGYAAVREAEASAQVAHDEQVSRSSGTDDCGSDSGGGAGIQADLKTFQELGVYGMSAITAITVQNTLGFKAFIRASRSAEQIEVVGSDLGVDALKTGMLFNAEIIRLVADRIRAFGWEKVVVDPVMIAKGGAERRKAKRCRL